MSCEHILHFSSLYFQIDLFISTDPSGVRSSVDIEYLVARVWLDDGWAVAGWAAEQVWLAY